MRKTKTSVTSDARFERPPDHLSMRLYRGWAMAEKMPASRIATRNGRIMAKNTAVISSTIATMTIRLRLALFISTRKTK